MPRPVAAGRRVPVPRAIVTGGAGFIGSHLVDRLVAEGHAVLVVDDLSTGLPRNVHPAATLETVDISIDDLDRLFRGWRPDLVFHLAAQASVPLSQRDPIRDLGVNLVGTHRVATAARLAEASRLVFVSSGGAVYGESARAATERARPAPTSYYGIHKLAAEGHVQLAGLPGAIARPANVYGPRQTAGLEGAVVAAFVSQALVGGSLTIHGDGSQTRDLVHVRDVVEALWMLATANEVQGIWNVATGRSVSILGLADLVERAVGRPLGRRFGPLRPGDVAHSSISASRLRGTGWKPATGLARGLAELVRDASTAARDPA